MRVKRLGLLSTACLAIILPTLTASAHAMETNIAAKLDEFMSAYNENCSYKYSGAVLVAKGDRVLLSKGYGMSNYEARIPNKPETVFAIGSITKSFTAVAIMQLQEAGLLNVNDPVARYIDGNRRGDEITIHHLLTHTSGLPRDGLFLGQQEVSLDEDVDFIGRQSLLFEPGQDHSYSNAGYQLLAAIIEKVSGRPYNDYVSDHILRPLKMAKSRGGTDASYALDQAVGYRMTTGDPAQLSIYSFSCVTGSGNIYSTVEDLYRYERGLGNRELLTAESLNAVSTPHWGDSKNGYGYGWEITERENHKRLSHGGNIGGGGYVSLLVRYPEDDYVLIFLTNNADRTALDVVSKTIEAIILEEEYVIPKRPRSIEPDPGLLRQFAGKYDLGRGLVITVSYENGKLYATADDGNIYELLPIGETSFHYENHQWVEAEFFTDRESNRPRVQIRNIGRVFEGEKVDN